MLTLYYHEASLNHLVPDGHPECPQRWLVLKERLIDESRQGVSCQVSPLGDDKLALLAHKETYVRAIKNNLPAKGLTCLDSDTFLSEGSWQAVCYALGAAQKATDEALADPDARAFLMHRPPGHHAEPDRAMGFCLINTAAVAARYALSQGLSRVAILDFDVHHGNGTQAIVLDDSRIGYFSSHEMPLYPGSGYPDERGVGNIHNCPLPAGSDGVLMRDLYSIQLLPALKSFAPELLIFSAGFDAHYADPLAHLNWQDEDYTWLTEKALEAAEPSTQGRTLSVLEGGYNLNALASSAEAHIIGLAGTNSIT